MSKQQQKGDELKVSSVTGISSDNPLLKELENLKGPHAKIMGYDYYYFLVAAATCLMLCMVWCYWIFEDDPLIQKLVVGQGFLSLGLVMSVLWFKSRLPKEESKDAKKNASKKQK